MGLILSWRLGYLTRHDPWTGVGDADGEMSNQNQILQEGQGDEDKDEL